MDHVPTFHTAKCKWNKFLCDTYNYNAEQSMLRRRFIKKLSYALMKGWFSEHSKITTLPMDIHLHLRHLKTFQNKDECEPVLKKVMCEKRALCYFWSHGKSINDH